MRETDKCIPVSGIFALFDRSNLHIVIMIPLWLMAGLKMSLPQKLGLIAVLCLGESIVDDDTIAYPKKAGGSVRKLTVVISRQGGVHPEITWLALWSGIESSVAVSVACMTSFRVLFTQMQSGSARNRSGPTNEAVRYGKPKSSSKLSSTGDNKKPWRSDSREVDLDSVRKTDYDYEMERLGRQRNAKTVCVGADEADNGIRLSNERDWPETSSDTDILPRESIRVHKTWRVQ
ncbi:hypothetical protein LTR62_003489 [Meristemomyces frigidus]|uniref:Uncharacterized protein n=1 Tax=Meristemomyces frigidus TaxID=1508187 RepID=A0AAN7TRW0_9PEZI|nr:hypothetical protein LTR62_003489 [Meristemomyces frigidus]